MWPEGLGRQLAHEESHLNLPSSVDCRVIFWTVDACVIDVILTQLLSSVHNSVWKKYFFDIQFTPVPFFDVILSNAAINKKIWNYAPAMYAHLIGKPDVREISNSINCKTHTYLDNWTYAAWSTESDRTCYRYSGKISFGELRLNVR